MSWVESKALERIKKLIIESPPKDVLEFGDYITARNESVEASVLEPRQLTEPLFDLDVNDAVTVDTVQMYISLVNYDYYRIEDDKETADSHAKALKFLHFYYSIIDRITENSAAKRVDFHGSRAHIVTIEQDIDEIEKEYVIDGISRQTIAQAFDFIFQLKQLSNAINMKAGNKFEAKFRIGIDVGKCVAINNGIEKEKEPMFLGSSANYAAKFAEGEKTGIYVSNQLFEILDVQSIGEHDGFHEIDEFSLGEKTGRIVNGEFVYGSEAGVEIAQNLFEESKIDLLQELTNPNFSFKYSAPPLSNIDFKEISPTNSIRMQIVSMYADLSGYTKYIDNCIREGEIEQAVQALYVIRKEFQNVVESDFGGRKIRFIGDCIHAVIAEGTESDINPRDSILSAAKCAIGINNSFKLCKNELKLDEGLLGLSVGIEMGETPISKIGIRGKRSVRIASSEATIISEILQKRCDENGIIFGKCAEECAPTSLKNTIKEVGHYKSIEFNWVETCLIGTTKITQNSSDVVSPRPHAN